MCYFYEVPTISWSYIRPTNNTHNLAYFLEMSATRTNNRHIARAVEQGASSPVLSQAGVVKNATGVGNFSLPSKHQNRLNKAPKLKKKNKQIRL